MSDPFPFLEKVRAAQNHLAEAREIIEKLEADPVLQAAASALIKAGATLELYEKERPKRCPGCRRIIGHDPDCGYAMPEEIEGPFYDHGKRRGCGSCGDTVCQCR